jgi:hypothetical protein
MIDNIIFNTIEQKFKVKHDLRSEILIRRKIIEKNIIKVAE